MGWLQGSPSGWIAELGGALGAFLLAMAGRPQDTLNASLATLVVLVIVALNPHHAAQQPVMRLLDTAIGVAVGLAAAWGVVRLVELAGRARGLEPEAVPHERS